MTHTLDGLLIVDKPSGWTSHDVVARIRRLTGVRRVGHAGTLDPLATGVLPLGIGKGTRVLEYLLLADKEYQATVRLGAATDTYDSDGRIVSIGDMSHLTEAAARDALLGFQGTITQRPPVFSAIKLGGTALHRLARAGTAVIPPERTVTVYEISDVDISLPDVRFVVRCSTGTYVRSIAHDLGERLGCGGHLVALRRTATAGFSIDLAITLDEFAPAVDRGEVADLLLPLDAALVGMRSVVLEDDDARRLRHGVPPTAVTAEAGVERLSAYDRSGGLIAVLERRDGESGWRAAKVFGGR